MVETTVSVELSADDVAALRASDDVSFHTHDGKAFVRVYLRVYGEGAPVFTVKQQRLYPEAGPFGDRGRQRTIPCEHRAYGYGRRAGEGYPARQGWNSEHIPGYAAYASWVKREVWGTVSGLLRPGDRLTLSWVADNNNHHLDRADLHQDELHVVVHRGERKMTFLLNTSVCAGNSARMVRQYG